MIYVFFLPAFLIDLFLPVLPSKPPLYLNKNVYHSFRLGTHDLPPLTQ